MDLGRAQIAYDNQEPNWADNSDKVAKLTEAYTRMIQAAVVTGQKYAYVTADGRDMTECPVRQIAEEMWSEHEMCREAIAAVMEGAPDEEVGKTFTALVAAIVRKVATGCAEDQTTAEEE